MNKSPATATKNLINSYLPYFVTVDWRYVDTCRGPDMRVITGRIRFQDNPQWDLERGNPMVDPKLDLIKKLVLAFIPAEIREQYNVRVTKSNNVKFDQRGYGSNDTSDV